jgi:hypothetical protein
MEKIMIRRITAMSVAFSVIAFGAAQADDMPGEDIVVPPPVVIEEAVTAAPPAFVSLASTKIGAGIGMSWGDGWLSYEGLRHDFSVKSLGIGDLGVAKLISEGYVSNLENLSDFAGTYVAVDAGAAVGVGVAAVSMRNEHGVVISLNSEVQGVSLSLGAEGIRITLD